MVIRPSRWSLRLPGHPYDGYDPDGLMSREEVVGQPRAHPCASVIVLEATGSNGWRLRRSQSKRHPPTSAGADREHLKVDAGRLAVRCDVPEGAATEQSCAGTVEGCAPDCAAAGVDGCREVDVVATWQPVDEPS